MSGPPESPEFRPVVARMWHAGGAGSREGARGTPAAVSSDVQGGRLVLVSTTGEELLEERRRRRRAGDPRLSAAGRELFARMTTGDLVEEFQAALDADEADDPVLGGEPASD